MSRTKTWFFMSVGAASLALLGLCQVETFLAGAWFGGGYLMMHWILGDKQ